MSVNKCKTYTNVYCPGIHTSWRLKGTKSLEINSSEKLLCCDSTCFAWNIPASINDCAKCNKSYITWMQSLSISEYGSSELREMMMTSGQIDVELKEDKYSCSPPLYSRYLEAVLKNIDLPMERLAEAYLKSRIMKWSRTSVEQKYKIPIGWLRY